jgi:uncharacterized membrane protein (UPF0127 family)
MNGRNPIDDCLHVSNHDRGTVLALRAFRARNLVDRTLGLMGQASLSDGAGMFLDGDNAIHTCFMRFAIDVVFVDDQGRVLHLIHQMVPWRISRIVWRARAVLELPTGILARSETQVGDRLTIRAT